MRDSKLNIGDGSVDLVKYLDLEGEKWGWVKL